MGRAAVNRLAAFALVIAGSFGTAYAVGQKLPGNPESKPHSHTGAAASPVAPAFSFNGYVLVTDATQPTAATLALHINGPDGKRVTEFADNHGSRLHVVLIRPDLSGFQHVHPDLTADGGFIVPVNQPGKWHIVIDSKPAGASDAVVLATNVDDEVAVGETPLPPAEDEVTVEGLTVTRQGLAFTLSSTEGLEPYLGQAAHLIAIRQGDLAYTHLHPSDGMAGMFMFTGSLTAGTYRLFLQFGYHGKVLTVPFTVLQP